VLENIGQSANCLRSGLTLEANSRASDGSTAVSSLRTDFLVCLFDAFLLAPSRPSSVCLLRFPIMLLLYQAICDAIGNFFDILSQEKCNTHPAELGGVHNNAGCF
jgi:hypothetical protein